MPKNPFLKAMNIAGKNYKESRHLERQRLKDLDFRDLMYAAVDDYPIDGVRPSEDPMFMESVIQEFGLPRAVKIDKVMKGGPGRLSRSQMETAAGTIDLPAKRAEMARAGKEAGAVADAQAFMAPTRPYDERAFESKLIDNRLDQALKKLLGHAAPKY